MTHIVEDCHLTRLQGGLRALHSADEAAVVWLDKTSNARRIEKQNTCDSYYVRGRHNNVDCFYLAQNYFKLPRQTIRENANIICLFPQDLKNLNHIFDDHVGSDMTKEEFRHLCKAVWEKQQGFVIIYLSNNKHNGKYRSGLTSFTYQIKLIFSLQNGESS